VKGDRARTLKRPGVAPTGQGRESEQRHGTEGPTFTEERTGVPPLPFAEVMRT